MIHWKKWISDFISEIFHLLKTWIYRNTLKLKWQSLTWITTINQANLLLISMRDKQNGSRDTFHINKILIILVCCKLWENNVFQLDCVLRVQIECRSIGFIRANVSPPPPKKNTWIYKRFAHPVQYARTIFRWVPCKFLNKKHAPDS